MIKLDYIDENYIKSLSALLQSSYLVNKISTVNYDGSNDSRMLINSIYVKDTFDTKLIYKDNNKLLDGYATLKKILSGRQIIHLH